MILYSKKSKCQPQISNKLKFSILFIFFPCFSNFKKLLPKSYFNIAGLAAKRISVFIQFFITKAMHSLSPNLRHSRDTYSQNNELRSPERHHILLGYYSQRESLGLLSNTLTVSTPTVCMSRIFRVVVPVSVQNVSVIGVARFMISFPSLSEYFIAVYAPPLCFST